MNLRAVNDSAATIPVGGNINRARQIVLVILAALIALVLAARIRYSGKPATVLPAESCNPDLWNHVYDRERLHVIQPCTAVVGRVIFIHYNADGDAHIALDPDNKSVLNLVNAMHGHRTLIVEAVCDHPPASVNTDALAVCKDFRSAITIPKEGDRVRVTGAYVTDRDNGWNEIHPATRIEVLR